MFNTWLNLNPGRFVPLFRRVKSKYQGYVMPRTVPMLSSTYTKIPWYTPLASSSYLQSRLLGPARSPYGSETYTSTFGLLETNVAALSTSYDVQFMEV